MSRGGHNRKSIEQHKRDGTYNVTKHGKVLPDAKDLMLVKPQDHVTSMLKEVDKKAMFKQFADHLYGQGMTTKIDSIMLSQLVEAQSNYVLALNVYKLDPIDGKIGGRAALTVADEQAKIVRIIMAEFRMLPSSRGGYTPSKPKKKNTPADGVGDFLAND